MKDEEKAPCMYALWTHRMKYFESCSLVHPNVTASFPALFLIKLFIFSKSFAKKY